MQKDCFFKRGEIPIFANYFKNENNDTTTR
jgi:hypothetical protein